MLDVSTFFHILLTIDSHRRDGYEVGAKTNSGYYLTKGRSVSCNSCHVRNITCVIVEHPGQFGKVTLQRIKEIQNCSILILSW